MSWTETAIEPSCGSATSQICPPRSVYLALFVRRFAIAKPHPVANITTGPGSYTISKGRAITQTIRLSKEYDLILPEGDSDLVVQVRITDRSNGNPPRHLRSVPLRIPIHVLPPK